MNVYTMHGCIGWLTVLDGLPIDHISVATCKYKYMYMFYYIH